MANETDIDDPDAPPERRAETAIDWLRRHSTATQRRSHAMADALWRSGIYEARLLASLRQESNQA